MILPMKKTLAQLLIPPNKYYDGRKKNQIAMFRMPYIIFWIFVSVLALSLSFNSVSPSFAEDSPMQIRMIREFEINEIGIQNPAGIAFSQHANAFHVVEIDKPSTSPFNYSNIVMTTAVEEQIGSARIPARIENPKNTAFDNKFNRFLIFQTKSNKLISIDATPDGNLDASSLKRYDARDFDLQDPQGMAVDPMSGQVVILDRAVSQIVQIQPKEGGSFDGAAISQVTMQINNSASLQGLAYEPTNGHYQVLNPAEQALYEINRQGKLVSIRDLSAFNLFNPQTLVYAPSGDPTDDPSIMNLYLVDASPTISLLEPNNKFQTTESTFMDQDAGRLSGRIIEFSLAPYPQLVETVPTDPVTLVNTTDTSQYQTPNDPTDDSIEYVHTAVSTTPDSFEYEICDGAAVPECVKGTVIITVSPGTLTATVESPQILSVEAINAPTAATDNATVLFNSWVNIDVLANDSFGGGGPGTGAIKVWPECATCVKPIEGDATVNTGPRSPDPSGLVYFGNHPAASYSNKLMISDGEVDEIYPPNPAAYTGYNLFVTTLSGTLDSTLTTYNPPDVIFSNEPTGVAYNPVNGFLYITDDVGPKGVYELNPGADGLYNTSDDPDPVFFGNVGKDPEGVAFDGTRDNGHVIVVDGVGREVYDIDLGNGKFNQNDSVTHFDVESLGINDPEGIEFNPDNNHLYILDSSGQKRIAETTVDGKLFRYLNISNLNTIQPAGLAYGPASNGGPGKNLYIVDRGVDNDINPLENDGKMFEVSFPANAPPYVDAGLDQAIVLPDNVTLDGMVLDDGLPDPPGSVTTIWTKLSGPGVVTFNPASAVDTTASFTFPGVYVLRLEAYDGARSSHDDVTVTVSTNLPPTVDAGPNQTITLPDVASLHGTVEDDGLPNPPGSVSTDWLKVDGPGLVTFADPKSIDTTASFFTPGDYILRLMANDSELAAFEEVTITVNPNPGGNINIWLPIILSVTENP